VQVVHGHLAPRCSDRRPPAAPHATHLRNYFG